MSQKEIEARNAVIEAVPAYSPVHAQGPTAESPFDFPSGPPPAFASVTPLPPSSPSSTTTGTPPRFQLPIAIPQITPYKTAPFLEAYAPPLIHYGITPQSWNAFLTTLSALLAAKVSQQALAHAADMGRFVTSVPKRFAQGTVDHTKAVGHNIRDSAKTGNYVGAAMGVVGGAITLPVGTAFRIVGGVLSLPGAAIGAIIHKPQTPRERAAAYAAAANEKWLGVRGLRAQLVDTEELVRIVGSSATRLVGLAQKPADRSAVNQMNALKEYISELEICTGTKLELGTNSLWLIVLQGSGATPTAGVNDTKRQASLIVKPELRKNSCVKDLGKQERTESGVEA